MIVVADAGPLIYLAAIGQFDQLQHLAPEILVPQAVFDEVVVSGAGLPGAAEVRAAAWIAVVTAARRDVVDALLASGLHQGESEAIAVAVERDADLLLVDERQARVTAEHGLGDRGHARRVDRGEAAGRHAALAPLLVRLRTAGMWLSPEVMERVLAAVGEAPPSGAPR